MNDLLKRYPKIIADRLRLRPMEASDEAELVEFFKRLPVDERHLFKDDVTKVAIIQGWIRNLD